MAKRAPIPQAVRWNGGTNDEENLTAACDDCNGSKSAKVLPQAAPMRLPGAGETIYTIRNQDEMVEAFRKIKERLGLTNAHCDDLACMTEGHTDKVLGPSRQKEIGPLTFSKLCWLFAVKFEMVVDMDQAQVMAEHWEDRQRLRPPEYSETERISAKLLEKAKPLVAKAMGKVGAEKKMIMLSAEHRSQIARKAAKSRWRKHRKRRVKVAQPAPVATA